MSCTLYTFPPGPYYQENGLTRCFVKQEKVEWLEEPVDQTVKQGTVDEVQFTAKLSAKGKKAKWYIRNQVGVNGGAQFFLGFGLSFSGSLRANP